MRKIAPCFRPSHSDGSIAARKCAKAPSSIAQSKVARPSRTASRRFARQGCKRTPARFHSPDSLAYVPRRRSCRTHSLDPGEVARPRRRRYRYFEPLARRLGKLGRRHGSLHQSRRCNPRRLQLRRGDRPPLRPRRNKATRAFVANGRLWTRKSPSPATRPTRLSQPSSL
jgi:hypothetical protein